MRDRGTFGTVTVSWIVTSNSTRDLTPSSGVITLLPGETISHLSVTSVADEVCNVKELTWYTEYSHPQDI